MGCIKYYPLVGSNSNDKIPMFSCAEKQIIANNTSLYLAEIIPHHYRLYARDPHDFPAYSAYTIHCPTCGQAMRAITDQVDTHRLALYVCPDCR